jgi:hypothetical protein
MAPAVTETLAEPTNGAAVSQNGDESQHAETSSKGNPIFNPRRLRVVCIGAGYSGLVLAHKYNHVGGFKNYIDLVIYEKNEDVGGTWLENKYPGIACDVCMSIPP